MNRRIMVSIVVTGLAILIQTCPKAVADTRYIDFNGGNDNSAGTRNHPWKHHPWDAAATGNAAACRGVHTYVFKRGVIYRGMLTARESGRAGDPIRLTSDPNWGTGEAVLAGSAALDGGWSLCTDADTPPGLPPASRGKTWTIKLVGGYVPRLLWEVDGSNITRVPMARMPNWKIDDPDDPHSQWWQWTGCVIEVTIELNSTAGLHVGDAVTGTGKWADLNETRDNAAHSRNRIVAIKGNTIRVDSTEWRNGELQRGARLTNGRVTAKILKVSGSADTWFRLIDSRHLTDSNPHAYDGAVVWTETRRFPRPLTAVVRGYDVREHSLRVNLWSGPDGGPRQYCRYFLEGLPQFLDTAGEFCTISKGRLAGRLYLRLPGDRDPNSVHIEVARSPVVLEIRNRSHIDVSDLSLRFANCIAPGAATERARHATFYQALIHIDGSCSHITIRNCKLDNAPVGIAAVPAAKADRLDYLDVSGNELRDIDGAGIVFTDGRANFTMRNYGARLIHVKILGNRLEHIGYRPSGHFAAGCNGDGINVQGGELVEVAHNVVDHVCGSGIFVFTGGDWSQGHVERPLLRSLVHHNTVTNSLLTLQDYGGIAIWMGGPVYVYDNISGNPVGFKNYDYHTLHRKDWYRTSCYGVAMYLDGEYKSYVFNNVLWGKNNNVNDRIYNAVGFNEAMGFMNTVFNNTIYCFGVGFHKGMVQNNRCRYLGNLVLDCGLANFGQEPAPRYTDFPTLAYARNVFRSTPKYFGDLAGTEYPTLSAWQKGLRKEHVLAAETGIETSVPEVANAAGHDFHLLPGAAAIDHGVKAFVPWALYGVVGEWDFYRNNADPTTITGENINMDDEWFAREMYTYIPRNNLTAHNVTADNYTRGILENWIDGALRLNGRDQYCSIADADLKRGFDWHEIRRAAIHGHYPGSRRKTVDMGTNNFLIEIVFRADPGHAGGLVGKLKTRGYELALGADGRVRMSLDFGTGSCSRRSSVKVADGRWHHLIAEVNRAAARGINLYVDGKLANGAWRGAMNANATLANNGDFLVGRTPGPQPQYFAGDLDFLRVSRGTLADAETTIQQLYDWEFNGPFLKDFDGRAPTGNGRDAGAFEAMSATQ